MVSYDPDGGFVTGVGWILSSIGAYTPDPTSEGRVLFGFVPKYQKEAATPTGNAKSQFKIIVVSSIM